MDSWEKLVPCHLDQIIILRLPRYVPGLWKYQIMIYLSVTGNIQQDTNYFTFPENMLIGNSFLLLGALDLTFCGILFWTGCLKVFIFHERFMKVCLMFYKSLLGVVSYEKQTD